MKVERRLNNRTFPFSFHCDAGLEPTRPRHKEDQVEDAGEKEMRDKG